MSAAEFAHPFRALSLSSKHAPLAVREQLALDDAACRQLLLALRHEWGLTDVLVLSTCQRTEVYYAAAQDRSPELLLALSAVRQRPIGPAWQPYFEVLPTAAAAVRHLFAVGLGLEARVVGDCQVIGQVKQAYWRAVAVGTAGPFLHRLLHAVFAAHKRVQAETRFRDGAASASYATLELVQEHTAHLARPRVLVVGMGSIGADVSRHLAAHRAAFGEVVLCNRTREKAAALAAQNGQRVVEFTELPAALREADVVISAVGCPQPLLTRQVVAEAMGTSGKLLVDLSVPRSVAPDVAQVPGVQLHDIDAVRSKTSVALMQRLAAVPQVQVIIAESLAELRAWSYGRRMSPLIKQLKHKLENLRQRELHRYGKRLSPAETALLEATTRSLMQQVLKQQVLHLKSAGQRADGEPLLTQLGELFASDHPAAA